MVEMECHIEVMYDYYSILRRVVDFLTVHDGEITIIDDEGVFVLYGRSIGGCVVIDDGVDKLTFKNGKKV